MTLFCVFYSCYVFIDLQAQCVLINLAGSRSILERIPSKHFLRRPLNYPVGHGRIYSPLQGP